MAGIHFFEQSINKNDNTVTGYMPIELDSGKQPKRTWDSHIKRSNTANLSVPVHIKQLQVNGRFKKVAEKSINKFNKSHKLQTFQVQEIVLLKAHNFGKTDKSTALKFFRL